MDNIKILVVDDEVNSTNLLKKVLLKKGLSVDAETDSVKAKGMIQNNFYDLIVSDLQMPEVSGMDLLKVTPKETLFIMITGYGSVTSAVESMKNGAYDYVNKPFNLEEFILKIDKALDKIKLTKELNSIKNIVNSDEKFPGIIGSSRKMQIVYDFIERAAKVNVNVLIQGSSGTGKELVARALHYHSDRTSQPFVAINCSAIPENLLESELFGHVKGAFTGATDSQKGVFEQANNGTLFLDEIGEMPHSLQAKLLRVLENWELKPIGSDKIKKVNVRLISATNQNLKEMIESKTFREDLFYRISTVVINLPVLNERIEDIPALCSFILRKISAKFNKEFNITAEAIDLLKNHNYKGNVRELENLIEQAAITATGNTLDVKHFSINKSQNDLMDELIDSSYNLSLKELEKKYILKILESSGGNKKKASELLGVDRKTLYNKLAEYGLK